jgi:transposase
MQRPDIQPSFEKLITTNVLLNRENEFLMSQMRTLRRELAMERGEDADQAELDLLLRLRTMEVEVDIVESKQAELPMPTKQRQGHGPTAQPQLERREIHYALLHDELRCPFCGDNSLAPMGDVTEDSEEITIEMKRVAHLTHKRHKYRCPCNGAVVTAPGPLKLIPGGRYSLDFAVDVATSKVVDHMPLHRQVKQLARHGLQVTRQTLWDQEEALADVLRPCWEALREELLESPYLHADETGFKLTDGDGVSRETLWVLTTEKMAWYTIGRKDFATAEGIFADYSGVVVADGYSVYEMLKRAGPLTLAHCWSHVLRKFREAAEHRPSDCREILSLIGQMYKVERSLTGSKEDEEYLEQRLAMRQEKSVPILDEIKSWMLRQTGLPRSDYMKAVKYMMARWEGLTRFAENPLLEPDNNRAENALRGPVVGRKNYLQFRSRKGCEVGSILFSLCETARLQGVAEHVYLKTAAQRALRKPGAVTLPRHLG